MAKNGLTVHFLQNLDYMEKELSELLCTERQHGKKMRPPPPYRKHGKTQTAANSKNHQKQA